MDAEEMAVLEMVEEGGEEEEWPWDTLFEMLEEGEVETGEEEHSWYELWRDGLYQ